MVLTGGGGKEVVMVAVFQLSDEKIQTSQLARKEEVGCGK
jgi:hypothetical protein